MSEKINEIVSKEYLEKLEKSSKLLEEISQKLNELNSIGVIKLDIESFIVSINNIT